MTSGIASREKPFRIPDTPEDNSITKSCTGRRSKLKLEKREKKSNSVFACRENTSNGSGESRKWTSVLPAAIRRALLLRPFRCFFYVLAYTLIEFWTWAPLRFCVSDWWFVRKGVWSESLWKKILKTNHSWNVLKITFVYNRMKGSFFIH